MSSTAKSATQLPPLPENEKNYAGIPEAVFVVSVGENVLGENVW